MLGSLDAVNAFETIVVDVVTGAAVPIIDTKPSSPSFVPVGSLPPSPITEPLAYYGVSPTAAASQLGTNAIAAGNVSPVAPALSVIIGIALLGPYPADPFLAPAYVAPDVTCGCA